MPALFAIGRCDPFNERAMSHKDRYKVIPSVYLILEREGTFLLSRRYNTGYEDGNYSLVAGHGEEGESLTSALQREIKEEAGIELDPDGVTLVLTMHRWCGDHARLDFFFTAKDFHGEIENKEPDKCDDLRWFSSEELPENIIPYIRKAIECVRTGVSYCEFDWSS